MVRRDGRHRGVGRRPGTGGRSVVASGGRHAEVSGGGAGPSAWHVAVGGGTVAVAAALALGVMIAGRVPPTTSDPAALSTGTAGPSAPGTGSAATGSALGVIAVATAHLGAPVAAPTGADVDPAAAPAARAPRGGQGHHRPPEPPGRPADPGGGRGQRDR